MITIHDVQNGTSPSYITLVTTAVNTLSQRATSHHILLAQPQS